MLKRVMKMSLVVMALGFFFVVNYNWAEEEGLVGHWHFDEGRGDIAKDVSGNHNDGEIHGGKWVKGESGYALEFDGVDDYVDCGNDASLNITDAITVEAWIKFASTTQSDYAGIVDKTGGNPRNGYNFHFRNPDKRVAFEAFFNGSLDVISSTNKTDWVTDQWYHVAVSYDKDADGNNLKIYVDGILNAQKRNTNVFGSNNAKVYIGRVGSHSFNGTIDEVRIYKRALSPEEIKRNYSAGTTFVLNKRTENPSQSKTIPFLYQQDFEENDPVKFWRSFAIRGRKTAVNFKGLTTEKAYSGKKSFKLDITNTPWQHYYYIPIRVPAEGKLKFSARVLVEQTQGDVRLGVDFSFPPAGFSGSGIFSSFGATKGEWVLVEGDIVRAGYDKAKQKIRNCRWGMTEEDVGIYADKIGIYLYGSSPRVVFYIDDIKIEGEVSNEALYQKEIKKRWSIYKESFNKKVVSWENSLEEIKKELSTYKNLSLQAEEMRKELIKEIASFSSRIASIKGKGYVGVSNRYVQSEVLEVDSSLSNIKAIASNIEIISKEKIDDTLTYIVSPITDFRILPDTILIPGNISNEISISACRGEYEPASFVIQSFSDISNLQIEATDLKGKKGIIPSSNVDIKVVKCWHQGWGGDIYKPGDEEWPGVLLPEFLLNDDSLIKIDKEKRKNYLKLINSSGEVKYRDINKRLKEPIRIPKGFSVKDSSILLPVNIPKRTAKQFWVTVHIPKDISPGNYTGKIKLKTSSASIKDLKLSVKVLPFRFSKFPFVSSIYYVKKIGYTDQPRIHGKVRSRSQFRGDMQNLIRHGVTNPMVYFQRDKELFKETLRIRNEVGMGNQPLYLANTWITHIAPSASAVIDGKVPSFEDYVIAPKEIKQLKDIIAIAKSYGITEVYFYGVDEAMGEKSRSQRQAWEAVHKVGGKVLVAGHQGDMTFENVGDLLDLLVCSGLNKEIARKFHSAGHKVVCYDNPQGGVEKPETYRRHFGFLIWKNDYDGQMTYGYQCSYHDPWNDFDDLHSRDHNFVYPTINGVIDTIAWEGYREGIDDLKYLTTLIETIKEVEKAGSEKKKKIASSAQNWVKELKESQRIETEDLNNIRQEIINYILKLKKGGH